MIEFTIKPGGQVHIEAFGYTGNDCQTASKPYLEALGNIQKNERKPDDPQARARAMDVQKQPAKNQAKH